NAGIANHADLARNVRSRNLRRNDFPRQYAQLWRRDQVPCRASSLGPEGLRVTQNRPQSERAGGGLFAYKGFGRRDAETSHALMRPASEKRQGTKSREGTDIAAG